VFWPSHDATNREIFARDLGVIDSDASREDKSQDELLHIFCALSGLPYVTVLFTWPGDVLYIPIGRMHTVLNIKLPGSSDLCVSGGVHLILSTDLDRMRHVVQNNTRIGVSKAPLLCLIKEHAEYFKVDPPIAFGRYGGDKKHQQKEIKKDSLRKARLAKAAKAAKME
jgi:hypothetical protein